MNLKDFSVSKQLIFGFVVMLFFVVILGVVSYRQSKKIHQQTEILYNQPLQVRPAIWMLQSDVLRMRLGTRDLMLAKTKSEQTKAILDMDMAEEDAMKQFDVIKTRYMGTQSDVESAYADFLSWKNARDENTRLAQTGEIEKVKASVKDEGKVGGYRQKLMAHINQIDLVSQEKAIQLYQDSNTLRDSLNRELSIIVLAILLLSFIIVTLLLSKIRTPIKELIEVTNRFRKGDLNARSSITLENEFGELSTSFNLMVDKVKTEMELTEKTELLADAMLIEDNSHRFFRELLPVLSELTNSQLAAVYLLSDDKQTYEHYESVGMTEEASKHAFSAKGRHGEFGAVLSSRKIQFIKNIPLDTRFVFQTVSGEIVPREIITIPILVGREVIAIVSLASIRKYSDQANQLIDRVFNILTARIEGILTYRRMRRYLKQVEIQNEELEIQRNEMEQQSAEMTEQNRELEMQKNQLYEASRLKTNFLSNMSHELRTPLNSVIALSGVLSRRLVKRIEEEEYSYLEVIERNGKHLLSLINDILDISRIEAGREEVEITKFNPNQLVEEIVCMIKQQAVDKNLQLIQTTYIPELTITSDSDKCRHILQNLIGNAIKFTEKGKIEVSVVQNEGNIEIKVADTGIGISEKHISHIFDEFRQADSSTSRKFGGTGLGLTIAQKFANLLGGTITVKSTENEGSIFTLSLPIVFSADNRVTKVVESAGAFIAPNFKQPLPVQVSKTILLVEDSEPAIIQIKDFLKENGYKIQVARSGVEAMNIISKKLPDALILDLMMPGVDGFNVLENLRNSEPTANIPVLILTAKHITKEDLKFFKRNNVHQLIQKGDVNRNELLNAVANLFYTEQVQNVESTHAIQTIKGKPTVLIVEDNPDNMITVKALLGDKFNMLEASDGNEGIEMAKKHIPNLILMDIALPGINGVEAFKVIRGISKLDHIPVIALTASIMSYDRETILSYGFDAFIPKPIDEKEFIETINVILYGK